MRYIERLAKPAILTQRAEGWQLALDSKVPQPTRPDSSKYGHHSVRSTLNTMSSTKCFYCETKLKGSTSEIDHFIEFVVNRQGAYTWENLYLSCDNCNNKFDENTISTTACLNPCLHLDIEIQTDLTFNDEIIVAKDNSERGRQTIRKYRLDTERLDYLRMQELKKLHKLIIEIQRRNDGLIPEQQREALKYMTQEENSYSLMFKVVLEELFG